MINSMTHKYIQPDWPAPNNIQAFSTTRLGGMSQAPYDSFNLGQNTADAPEIITANRQLLKAELQLSNEPSWIKQVHSNQVIKLNSPQDSGEADASFTTQANTICAILTADCLPLLICDDEGTTVAAIHAGWRGLLSGVIENTIKAMAKPGKQLLAWLGPAIGPSIFELGNDIQQQFLSEDPQSKSAFTDLNPDKCLANIYTLARQRLARVDVTCVYGGEFCTYSDQERFYSHRRDKGFTGRMASLIWIAQ